MATELEIKLTLTEPAQQQALNWLLSLPQAEKGHAKTLINRYYDTPEAALNQARAALRVRQTGDRYIQTLKTRGQFLKGAHNRQEWEWDLPGPELDLSLLEQTPLHHQVDLSNVRTVFETNFQRQEILLKDGDNEIEVAVDAGQVLGDGRARPLHEVEFELKAGDAGCLMRQASKLAEQVPVFLNLVSKAEQGYYLAGIYQPEPGTPEGPLSVTAFLHLLSISWLTGKPVQLPETVLINLERAAEQAAMSELWSQAGPHLQAGISAAQLIRQLPELGQLQLALAAQAPESAGESAGESACMSAEPWSDMPAILAESLSGCWSAVFPEQVPDWLLESGLSESDIAEALARSQFLRETLERHPGQVQAAVAARPLTEPTTEKWLADRWAGFIENVDSEAALHTALRQFRREAQFRIIWRDSMRWADLHETMAAASMMADTCIDGALSWLYETACEEFGTPYGADPVTGEDVPQSMVVLGMGKLGGRELNVSSDIDLIFAFPGNGETRGGRRALDNQQFFVRLGQRLIQALDQMTADGFVFRVDMRLRPYGQSGALALSFAALEAYYQDQGRDWERYAMVKARVVAGDRRAGAVLMDSLRPFVYRKYIDFSAFESLRGMKAMIGREVRRKGLENNIKLGSGGIREIEFVVQAFQLIRGGRDRELQQRELLTILRELETLELLPPDVVGELREAYVFLRNLEHALQGIEDKQTQTLPEDDLNRARAALIMGFDSWDECQAVLDSHRERVATHFANIIATEEGEEARESELAEEWQELWLAEMDDEAALGWLRAQGYENPAESCRELAELRDGRTVETLQTQGRKRLNQFMPVLLEALTGVEKPSQTLSRVLQLVSAILRRTAYMVLLLENPGARTQLVRLCSESPWVAQQLAETPLLLDELLNAESLYTPPAKAELQDDLRQQMLRIPFEDLEEQMESLRHFKRAHILRVAASEIKGTLPLMKVSDYLTWIAEVVLDHVVDVAFANLVSRHGYPRRSDGSACETDFAIIGYGKLGGIELGYTSDLDLVFVHKADPELSTDGDKPIDNAVFFTRLGQRIVHILSAQTPSGQLYEVDMRLRPSGNSGLLVTTLSAFEKYQRNDAWTWEHQALARARGVAGCIETLPAFEAIRHDILCQRRDRSKLRKEVVEMREKMRASLGTPKSRRTEVFHIKHDPGGIIDIEFMVQYLMLAWCSDHPELTRWSDNIRQMEELGRAGVLPVEDAKKLREVFITLRSTIHRRALQNLNSQVEGEAFPQERDYIRSLWKKLMLD